MPKLDGNKFLITGDNSSEITRILQEAEQSNDAWVFASPAIQEGVSIESEKFNFTAYIQSGCPGLLRPIHKGLQGLHRVRNSKAVRVVCILGWEQEEIIDEEDSLEKLYTEYVQRLSLVEEYIKHTLAGNSPHNNLGEKAVKNGHKNPKKKNRVKKTLLTPQQIEKLKQELESIPSPEDGIWTGPKVARWIEKETGIEKVWNQRGWDYLKKCPKGLASRRSTHGRVRDQNIVKEIN